MVSMLDFSILFSTDFTNPETFYLV